MADSIPVFGVRAGDEGIRRDLHVAGRLGYGADLYVAIGMTRVVCVDNAVVNVVEQGLKGARRDKHTSPM